MNDNMNNSIETICNDFGEGTSFDSNKFPNDSIDRFSDGIIEEILSYLTFSEKVLFESISKQWKRVIYNNQTELHLNRDESQHTLNKLLKPIVIKDYVTGYAHYAELKSINKCSFESVLKKCKFIKTIELNCYCDGEDLELLGKYCPYLESFECESIGFNEENLVEFGFKYGHRLKKVNLYNSVYSSVFIKKFFKFCVNLTQVYTEENNSFISESKEFLPQLKSIKFLDIKPENLNHLKVLSEKYWNKMEKLIIFSYNLTASDPQTALTYISRFQNLQKLDLYLCSFDANLQTIDENMKQLGKNCAQLKEFVLTIQNNSFITEQFFHSFENFNSLVKLNLSISENWRKLEGSVQFLKSCHNLKYLYLTYPALSDEFFEDIHLFVPNLLLIDFDCETQLTDKTIFSLSKLQKLKIFHFRKSQTSNKLITDQSVCQLINSSQSIEMISFNARPNITHKTIEAFLALALKKPRIEMCLFCGISNLGDEVEFDQIDINSYVQSLPNNLQITIVLGNFL